MVSDKCKMVWKLIAVFILSVTCSGIKSSFTICSVQVDAFNSVTYICSICNPLNSDPPNKICQTTECYETASFILNHMDPSASPCTDFYRFACGRFSSPDKNAILYAMKNALHKVVSPQIEEIFMPKSLDYLEPGLQRAFAFYNACTRVNSPLSTGAELILREVPELDDWNSKQSQSASWIKLIQKTRDMGLETNYIITAGLKFNPEDSSTFILRISPPSIDTKEWKFLSVFTPETSKRITSSINLPEVMNKTRNFQRLLNDVLPMPSSSSLYDYWQQPYITKISTLQNEYPLVDWQKLLQATVGAVINITKSQVVSVHSRGFIWNLERLLTRTDNSIISNYLRVRILNRWTDIVRDFYPRNERNCRENTNTLFGKVVVLKLLKAFYREDKKRDIHNMIVMIKKEIGTTFEQSSWIQLNVRQKLLKKLDAIGERIGSDEDISRLNEAVNNLYKNLQTHSKDYFVLLLNVLKVGSDLKFSAINDPFSISVQRLDQTNWPTAPFYQPNIETMVVPGSFLADFMYTANRPTYLNFGLIGSIIGHELLHAFHKNGIYINPNGTVEELWTSEASLEYSKRADCLVKQYNSKTIPGTNKKINGHKTFNENFADNEGVRAAYRAYQLWLEQHPYEESLPNLNYTSKQMFWITHANLWCAYLPHEELLKKVPNYTHAPPWDRVNAVFSNIDEFATDFACAQNSNMNPIQKCSMWK